MTCDQSSRGTDEAFGTSERTGEALSTCASLLTLYASEKLQEKTNYIAERPGHTKCPKVRASLWPVTKVQNREVQRQCDRDKNFRSCRHSTYSTVNVIMIDDDDVPAGLGPVIQKR